MQKKIEIILLVLLLVGLLITPKLGLAAEEKSNLEEFKEEVTTKEQNENNRRGHNHQHHDHHQNDDSFWTWVFKEIFFRPIFAPRRSRAVNIIAYPYLAPYRNLELPQRKSGSVRQNDKDLTINTSLTKQYVASNDLGIQTAAWRLDSSIIYQRLVLDLAQTRYYNNLGEGLNCNEALVSYIFAQNREWQFKTGLGLEEIAGVNGFKYQYAIDYQQDNLGGDVSFALTRLATNKTVFEFGPGVAYLNQDLKLRLGYRFKEIKGTSLLGPELTAQLQF
ncbi:MAG: hypothetical protein ACQEP9_08055 [Bacillota bacterium]